MGYADIATLGQLAKQTGGISLLTMHWFLMLYIERELDLYIEISALRRRLELQPGIRRHRHLGAAG